MRLFDIRIRSQSALSILGILHATLVTTTLESWMSPHDDKIGGRMINVSREQDRRALLEPSLCAFRLSVTGNFLCCWTIPARRSAFRWPRAQTATLHCVTNSVPRLHSGRVGLSNLFDRPTQLAVPPRCIFARAVIWHASARLTRNRG